MSAKRQATNDLNHDNWDREEEPEERGTFRTASENELKSRVIKKARRKVAPNDGPNTSSASSSIFSGFSGFGRNTPTTSAAATPFSFLSKLPAATATSPTSTSNNTIADASKVSSSASKPQFSFAGGTTSSSSNVQTTAGTDASKKSNDLQQTDMDSYYGKLKGLNMAVCAWIKTHVDKNPICILKPIFADYERYLNEIESERNNKTSPYKFSTSSSTTFSFGIPAKSTNSAPAAQSLSTTGESTGGIFSGFSKPTTGAVGSTPNMFGGFSKSAAPETSNTNGFKPDEKVSPSTSKPMFGFGTTSSSTSGFSFSKTTPISFGNIQPPATAKPVEVEDVDEDDQPPKAEFVQVVENDAIYSKKCKVFVKKDSTFVDRGVGTLFLKPVEKSGKTQLLVRADTNLGNILVNLILNAALPTQRMGKNNVMMICLPTPEHEKPTSMLLRVKTGDEADELLDTIEKYKK